MHMRSQLNSGVRHHRWELDRVKPMAYTLPVTLTTIILLTACVGAPAGGAAPRRAGAVVAAGPLASDTLALCTAPIQGLASWRAVSARGFSVCVPGDWRRMPRRDPSAAQGGRWEGGGDRSFEWGVGPFAKGPGEAMPYNDLRQQELRLGSRKGRRDLLGIGGRVTYEGWFAADTVAGLPAIRLAGFAEGADASQQVQVIFQSLRPQP